MTNEALVSYSRLTLDNRFKDPELLEAGGRRHHVQRHLPGRCDQPVSADGPPSRMGTGSGQVGNLWAKANDMYAHNDALQFSNKLTKLLRARTA